MLQSMTGFAAGQGASGDFSWTWEIRGVNAKGLDLRIRVPDWVEGLEAALRKQITGALKRGNVTVNLRLSRVEAGGSQRLNHQQLDQVLTALAEIEQQAITRHVSLAPSTAAEIIALRGMMEQDEEATDTAALQSALVEDFQTVLASFCEMRSGEGAALQAVLNRHLDEIEGLVTAAGAAAEARRPKARETLKTALAAVMEGAAEMDEDRIVQELALLAVKSDITEEINRLNAHVKAARELVSAPGSVGRKLDFLMQEFNREANTLCAKSGDSALTAVGLDLKAVIDQMREQVQNVE
ncbi:YicC/YloC family endoribonuclease [Marinovum sp.]|uniref:YicC/YloC family endoribonuclease n=1 Tax=Marinovum sp. TaxID=2024839 RepID=UPI002B26AB8A|nr:YicC/YloC family endoribonuclease [Marinovum sp.]